MAPSVTISMCEAFIVISDETEEAMALSGFI